MIAAVAGVCALMAVAGSLQAQPPTPVAPLSLRYGIDGATATLEALRRAGCTETSRPPACPIGGPSFQLFADAVAGDRHAQVRLASKFLHRPFPTRDDAVVAMGWYGRAAESGDDEAAWHYNAIRTQLGHAAVADDAKIVARLKARDSGLAHYVLSEMYLHGRGVAPDAAESMRLLRQAAAEGVGLAQEALRRRTPP